MFVSPEKVKQIYVFQKLEYLNLLSGKCYGFLLIFARYKLSATVLQRAR